MQLDEAHDKISLSSLSQSLIGLSSQALSFRRESNDRDYLHKFYEQLTLEKEHAIAESQKEGPASADASQHFESTNVSMAREYLKAFKIFDREVEKIQPRLMKLIEQSKNDFEGMLHCLLALSACQIEAPTQRLMIFDSLKKLMGEATT